MVRKPNFEGENVRLVERRSQWTMLIDAFESAASGVGRLVLISGGPGSGKSELMHEFCAEAQRRGAHTMIATGSHTDHDRPLALIRQLIPGLSSDAGDVDVRDEALTTISTLALDQTVVIAIDDAYLMDGSSIDVFLHILRGTRNSPVLILGAHLEQTKLFAPEQLAEILRQPYRRIHLPLLTQDGVRTVVRDRLGVESSDVDTRFHSATGGNPMLVHALIDDTRSTDQVTEPTPAGSYRDSVLACLYRGERARLRIAREIAVLGASVTPDRVADLTGEHPTSVDSVVELLSAAGLLDGYQFRYGATAAVLMSDIDSDELSRMHLDIARLLYHEGEDTEHIAVHLHAADSAVEAWSQTVLERTAEHAIARDDVETAAQYLRLALRDCRDLETRQTLTVQLARVEWRMNPAAAGRRLALLERSALDGSLGGRDSATVVRNMLWRGDVDTSAEATTALDAGVAPENANSAAELEFVRQWFYGVSRATRTKDIKSIVALELAGRDIGGLWPRAAMLVSGVADDDAITSAAHALKTCRFDEMSLEVAATTLFVIAVSDRASTAVDLCDHLLGEATRRGGTTWEALLMAVRGEIAMLQGDIATAADLSTRALEQLGSEGWGVVIGLPLSTAILSRTITGDHVGAATLLTSVVPDSMYRTMFGARFLRARGHHFLATERAGAAINDFETCGQLLRSMNPAMQKLIPWRIDLAHANLWLGKSKAAGLLAEKQLSMQPGLGSRSRAVALRTLAASGSGELRQRATMLRESIDLFQDAGDRLGLARSLTDLAAIYYELGEFDRARAVARHGAEEARACNVEVALGVHLDVVPASIPESSDRAASPLSDAEARVASLASLGYTNREISKRIHVTISTVEQHLTRVYRKLGVRRRSELAAHLSPTTPIVIDSLSTPGALSTVEPL
ncbi:LuxR family transcriptional regulator [Rhodococcus sp. 14-2470-1a]|uniref:helix-turn-helix transcriptional regulator n=1 Tax=Rhodococcus sp. 14-2470-1a TaxID=2023150 RepID=UPI000B9BE4C2|nr:MULTISPECIES: LuxR family transcriptional regulator [unclassified Rhodococcus (in: high G+C Gram-positive bacteria)]OZD73418.1 hypothetical protein CH263_02455 [Rhodococcus sp. 06-1059B-a]OZF56643.1 hypothetical protein CH292_03150 [Rhodococcus sp. 14-2470-1a]